jgi:hypothetical protein
MYSAAPSHVKGGCCCFSLSRVLAVGRFDHAPRAGPPSPGTSGPAAASVCGSWDRDRTVLVHQTGTFQTVPEDEVPWRARTPLTLMRLVILLR